MLRPTNRFKLSSPHPFVVVGGRLIESAASTPWLIVWGAVLMMVTLVSVLVLRRLQRAAFVAAVCLLAMVVFGEIVLPALSALLSGQGEWGIILRDMFGLSRLSPRIDHRLVPYAVVGVWLRPRASPANSKHIFCRCRIASIRCEACN
jgi:hypothetical protein